MTESLTFMDDELRESWLKTLTQPEAVQLAANWMETARQHARNENYWRERALKAEGKTEAEIEDWGH